MVVGEVAHAPYTEYIPGQPIYSTTNMGDSEYTYISGYTPSQTIGHDTIIGSDSPNTGHITASDLQFLDAK